MRTVVWAISCFIRVVGARKEEPHPNSESQKRPMTSRGTEGIQDGVFHEMLGSCRVVVVGVITDLDGGGFDQRP